MLTNQGFSQIVLSCVQLPSGVFAAPQADADGYLKVCIAGGSAVINCDLATVDVAAIVSGIAGATPKTLAELHALQSALNGDASGYLDQTGGEQFTTTGAAQTLTIPATTTLMIVNAEGGEVRYAEGGNATATSGGRVPEDGTLSLPIGASQTWTVYLPTGSKANVAYFKRVARA